MAASGFTPISLYYSSTAAAVPLAANLVAGELSLNTNDGKLYYKNSSSVVTLLASTSGASGDVVGPASSTDNALARFDLATGKLIQNSVGILSDAGILTGLTGITSSGSITLSSLTSGRVPYATTAGLLTDSAGLTFDGTNFATTGTATAAKLIPTGSSATGNGMYLPAANSVGISTNGTNAVYINSTQNVGIGTSSPSSVSGYTVVSLNNATNGGMLDLLSNGSQRGRIYATTTQLRIEPVSTVPLVFVQNTGTELMRIDTSGNVGIGSTLVSGLSLRISKSLTPGTDSGATDSYGVRVDGNIPAAVTGSARLFSTYPSTSATAFTVSTLAHYTAGQGAFGAGSSVTSQNGFYVDASMVGGINNSGLIVADIGGASATTGKSNIAFYSAVSAASGGGSAWNIYMAGSAPNYFAGKVGIGTSSPGDKLEVSSSTQNIVISRSTASYAAFQRIAPTGQQTYDFYTINGIEVARITGDPSFLAFSTGSSATERMRISAIGDVLIGSAASAGNTLRYFDIYNTDSGASAGTIIRLITSNAAASGSTTVDLVKYKTGGFIVNNNETNAAAFTAFQVGASERMRIDSSGNVLVVNPAGLGYGTGSGGTVTQATSKSTGVTLNKPTGQITMNNALLLTNTTVGFALSNSLLAEKDNLILNITNASAGGGTGGGNYNIWATPYAGGTNIWLKNISAGSLSEALVINFSIIKGATS